jgi:hypothetical protein
MRQTTILLGAVFLTLAGCNGDIVSTSGGGGDVGTKSLSLEARVAAHEVIVATRPKASTLMVERVNLTLAKHNILDTVVRDLENRVLSSLTDGAPDTACPYLTNDNSAQTTSCRFLVDQALQDALVDSVAMQDSIEQDVVATRSAALKSDEVQFVRGWVGEAVMSGLDVAAVHAVEMLRDQRACDQAPNVTESAFLLGERQGKALLESTATELLPTIPHTICNTDVIAQTILTAAADASAGFVQANPICAGYAPADLARQVDLSQAELNRKAGLDEGMRQAYEALRVRLVNTWECIACTCFPVGQWQLDAHGCSNVLVTDGVVCFNNEDIEGRSVTTADDVCQLSAGGVNTVPPDQCTSAPPLGDPLVLDVSGAGLAVSTRRVPFDLADTGEAALVPVLGAGNALLVLDRDANGRIDSGAELFSNASACGARRCRDGIEALAALDANADGVIDARDAAFRHLRLWFDDDADGLSRPAELLSLEEAGIGAITLAASAVRPRMDQAGNLVMRTLGFTRVDGTAGTVYDVWYSIGFDRVPSDPRTSGIVSTFRR